MTDLLFDLKKLLTAVVLPPLSPVLLMMLGLLLLRRRMRLAQLLLWSGLSLLLFCSLPITATLLARVIQVPSGLDSDAAAAAQAVVVLAGGRQTAPEYGGETVSALTLERLRYGAKLAKERQLPLLLSGGTVYRGGAESELMDRALQQSFGMQSRWLERRSRDTHQNAVYSAAILESAGIRTVLLVTHDFHERRSIAEFRAAGIEAVPAPVTMMATTPDEFNIIEQLPGALSLRRNVILLHEILGNAMIWLGANGEQEAPAHVIPQPGLTGQQ